MNWKTKKNTTEREKSMFDKSCEIDDDTPKKRRNRLNPKKKGNDKDDDWTDVGDSLSKLVGILSEDVKKPHHDIGTHIIEIQAQQKIEEEKTKQLEMSLQMKKMELEMAILQQQKWCADFYITVCIVSGCSIWKYVHN